MILTLKSHNSRVHFTYYHYKVYYHSSIRLSFLNLYLGRVYFVTRIFNSIMRTKNDMQSLSFNLENVEQNLPWFVYHIKRR